jgi:hypothetical protein
VNSEQQLQFQNTVAKQDFAVVEQVDGRVKALENCNVLVRKNFPPKKLSTGGGPKKAPNRGP